MKVSGRHLRQKYPGIYSLLISAINGFIKLKAPYSIYITDSLGGSFKKYLAQPDMDKRIAALKNGLDAESEEIIDVIIKRVINYPDEKDKKRVSRKEGIIGGLLDVETKAGRERINQNLKVINKNLKFPSKYIEESVFYFCHGLTLLPPGIPEYIKDQDFIDAGAFIGDSAIALRRYGYRKIYSIEMSLKSIEKYRFNLKNNNIGEDEFVIIHTGLGRSSEELPVRLYDTGSSGLSFLRKSGKYDEIPVEIKSLDHIVENYGITPRFIKVDIEGNSLDFVLGASSTLKRFRPVFSIAIYHNPIEFFEVKPLLDNLLNGYEFMVRKLSGGIKNNQVHSEVVLLGYPKEILKS